MPSFVILCHCPFAHLLSIAICCYNYVVIHYNLLQCRLLPSVVGLRVVMNLWDPITLFH